MCALGESDLFVGSGGAQGGDNMDNQKVNHRADLSCTVCGSADLRWPWAGRTNEERIYIVFVCGGCEAMVPIEIDKIIASLYEAVVPIKGSKAVS